MIIIMDGLWIYYTVNMYSSLIYEGLHGTKPLIVIVGVTKLSTSKLNYCISNISFDKILGIY